ncbi:sn-glycerol-3-phosphate ABC transporter ATP-binding protein UgpC [Loktanella sp. SALINAS62]|uniref:ABC transporter ATP-binding protein n=1 Tax=Loktanella sp. SALINAS62 TaxID=2706124 RepID=UPI001B8C07E5|nr:sn-glycerol-3-phosphate ABC transporter ATP-binding protein UgpC [Loktanella sp. SALINAS62]MBS1302730.1 sn-glycerol-3-phosphate ABC transporter ATP-binding protein UgpC [Loktanella sp. SALINAS62]
MTAQIEIENIDKHYGAYHALKNVDVRIPQGQFVALVGPSGCGKSTLLRTIAGLETITSGKIRIAGKDVSAAPPRARDLAMVFQSYALYPHKTVAGNMMYALRLKGMTRKQARARAEEIAQITGLDGLMDRYPRELSGGQRQRVAMGRAIVREPQAFLFDEPLSNLDAALRVHMRAEIRKLHDRIGATSVYVTHDQIEAMTMADHVVVMRAGVIEQQGAPLDLYDHPVNRFVAGFIGSPAMNFIPGQIAADGRHVVLDLPGAPRLTFDGRRPADEPVTVGLRPEHLVPGAGDNMLTLPVAVVERTGSSSYVLSDTTPPVMIAASDRLQGVERGDIQVTIKPSLVHLFSQTDDLALSAR